MSENVRVTPVRVVQRTLQGISKVLGIFAGLCVLAIMGVIIVEVVARTLFDSTVGGSIEIGELLLSLMVFAGIAYAQQAGAHVSTDLLVARVPAKVSKTIRALGLLVVIAVCIWAAIATLDRGLASFEARETTYGVESIPLWPGRLLAPVGFALLAVELVISMVMVFVAEEKETAA